MADSTNYSTAINPGAPPLRWDNVYEAFQQVNANFEMIEAALGSAGITPINFNDLDSGVTPAETNTFTLGTASKQWKRIHTAEYLDVPGNELNGLWAGDAHVKGIGTTIDLPLNSTVDGNLIIDPDKTWFQSIQVDNNESIVATIFNDTFGLISGTGINLNVDSSSESIIVTNSGIVSASAGLGISVSGTNPLLISNTGVRSITNTASIGTRTPGLGIHTSSSNGTPLLTNTGVISISQGVGITVSLDAVTGDVTVSNSAPAVNTFSQIVVDGDSLFPIIADSTSDTLNVTAGYAITLTKNTTTDTINIAVNPGHDIRGSVFADDSTLLVDGVSGRIVGPVFANVTGNVTGNITGNLVGNTNGFHLGDMKGSVFGDDSSILVDAVSNFIYGNVRATTLRTQDNSIILGQDADAGNYSVSIGYEAGLNTPGDASVAIGLTAGRTNQSNNAVAIGRDSAYNSQGDSAVAIGFEAGNNNQGIRAVAIGYRAGYNNQTSGSIVINASGVALNGSASGFYVDPIRSTSSSARPVVYDSTTKELSYTSTLEFINSTISTTDSSGLTVDVQTTFNTDVRVENDLTVLQSLTANQIVTNGIRGYISTGTLKTIVAASTSFADFQTRIAALNSNIAL